MHAECAARLARSSPQLRALSHPLPSLGPTPQRHRCFAPSRPHHVLIIDAIPISTRTRRILAAIERNQHSQTDPRSQSSKAALLQKKETSSSGARGKPNNSVSVADVAAAAAKAAAAARSSVHLIARSVVLIALPYCLFTPCSNRSARNGAALPCCICWDLHDYSAVYHTNSSSAPSKHWW